MLVKILSRKVTNRVKQVRYSLSKLGFARSGVVLLGVVSWSVVIGCGLVRLCVW